MKVSDQTISAISRIITGDNDISPYRSEYDLVRFFNQLGFQDSYGQPFPPGWFYAEEKLGILNGTPKLDLAIQLALDPRNFINTECQVETAVADLNSHLRYEGYKIVKSGLWYKVRALREGDVDLETPFTDSFIEEQIEKCDRKITDGDFDGAITNARSLLEAVLKYLEGVLDPKAPEYDGDLIKLYRRVQKLLNLDPARKDVSEPLKQILSGLISIVSGLAGLRNKMSDAHAPVYRPSAHHAKLAVNAAKTVANFIFDTYSYQTARGKITSPTKES